ncbi:MFS transporter [Streptomyces sp. NRRL S-1448]|uniref:MFS transporter n=1 Tax=Streptomyces sp. NRRL S-1448 TaxID=1463883 RepID=UPI0005653A59|nr:MFS transporter [Streptomyces sp. NRRL S-1448]
MTAGLPTRRAGRYRWIVLGIATFTQAASAFFVQGIGAMGIDLQRDLHLSTAQLGLLLSAAQLLPLIGLLVAGELLDRYNERWVVGIGGCVVAAGLLVGSVAPGYLSLLLVLLVVGAGYSTVQPGGSKSVASWFDASRRGLAMGIRQAGLPLGAALASAVLPLLAAAAGWRATLVAGGLVALLGAGAFMGFYRQPPTRAALQEEEVPSAPRGPSARPGWSSSLRAQLGARLRMLREPAMVRIMLSGASLISVQTGVGILTVLHLHERASVGAGAAALVLVAAQAAGAVGRIVLAWWSDRRRSGHHLPRHHLPGRNLSGRHLPGPYIPGRYAAGRDAAGRDAAGRYVSLMTCMVAVIAGLALLMTPVGSSPVAACAVFVWLGFFGLGWYGPWVAYVTESAPPDKTGFALGLAMSVNQIAIVVMPPALGLLKDGTGSFTPVWGLLSLLTAVALMLTARGERRAVGRSEKR